VNNATASAPSNNELTPRLPAIKRGWIRALIGMFVISIVSGLGTVPLIVSGAITPEMMALPPSELFAAMGINLMVLMMLLQVMAAMLAIFLLRKFIDRQSVKSLGFALSGYRMDLVKGLGWGAGLIASGFLILYATGFVTIEQTDFMSVQWLGYIAFFILAAFYEEILIRGYVLNNFMASMSKYWALPASSVLFTAMHLANDNISVLSTFNLFLAGILLGIYTIHKRNLWFPVALHFSWNFFQGPVLGFEVSGMQTDSMITQQVIGHELITGGEFGFEGSLLLTVMMIASTCYIHQKYKAQ